MKYKGADSLHQDMMDTGKALLDTLSPQQWALFDAYEAAGNRCSYDICLQAFRDGVRLAVKVILAGYTPASNDEGTVQQESLQTSKRS